MVRLSGGSGGLLEWEPRSASYAGGDFTYTREGSLSAL